MPAESEQSIRKRILDATFEVVARCGRRKLQILDVAATAGVSRPTVYRYFGSKEGLLDAFALYEQDNFAVGMAAATAGLRGIDRVNATLEFIVDYQFSHSLAMLVELEPEYSIAQMVRVLPIMEEGMRRVLSDENADIAAAAVVRIAVCHYLVGGGDRTSFLAELRHAAGLEPRRRRNSVGR
ncbi:TetR family transcriptional regulator [Mycolicibacter heraklionensis]|uniref:TetR family transcriptional regulator n=1 Tax=Mycolicibacter heraklionensis TaxID=512402 RepID=A0A9X7WJX8_9MYCO|nr:TetR/AcrR family transcriptional regulator [Mycolicibacter heraklionensis]KLO26492.1 TetR family transcriptional regulator [Mycolicibacter heraklionensis]QZA09645.1 TetR/AcrR family transcriptional regulator [Mycolicibacter heraklionensis]